MIREDIEYIFKELGTKHKAIRTSYVGLESEFNVDSNVEYPAMLTTSINSNKTVQKSNFTKQHNVTFWVIEMLPSSRTSDDINRSLNKIDQIIDELLARLDTHYNETELTINNRTVKTDFLISPDVTNLTFWDESMLNHTGFQVNLSITERIGYSTCCLDDVFDA